MPVEPPSSVWNFPPASSADEAGVVAIGGDLAPGTLLDAYRRGLFPMHIDAGGTGDAARTLGWWSPDPRGVLPLDRFRVTRSMQRSRERYEIRIDSAFDDVVVACADPNRPHGWITSEIRSAYGRLHELGWAHSVEAWSVDDGVLAGGLYGVCIGGLFAGESMFHRRTDASKVALMGLVDVLRSDGVPRLLDVQWTTAHLVSLGAVDVPRDEYLDLARSALRSPAPPEFG